MLDLKQQIDRLSSRSMHQLPYAIHADLRVLLTPRNRSAIRGRSLRPIPSRRSRRRSRSARRRRRRDGASVVRHVCLDEMACTQRAVERQFSCEDTSADDAGQLACVVAGCFLMRAAYPQKVEHGGLRLQDCAAADSANFD